MSFTNQTTHYGLPQWIGSDKPTYLVDQNNAYQKIDAEIYNANTTAGAAQTAAEGAVATAGAASTTASDALTAAQTASSTADNALTEAQTANTNAQAAQTAAGAAQTAAQAAQEAAAGNSITNLAPAYDPTITYAVDDLVTAEGKLYKCIVAVTSPEQFDINKWDDVTTSEVYARGGSGGDVYTKAECDAKFETQLHASSTYETKTNVTNKNNLKLAINGGGAGIRFGIDGNGNYGYVKDGADTVYPFSSGGFTEIMLRGAGSSWHDVSGGVVISRADLIQFQNVKKQDIISSGDISIYSMTNYNVGTVIGSVTTNNLNISSLPVHDNYYFALTNLTSNETVSKLIFS